MKLMSDSLDTVGVMARSVADCALFAAAVSGRDLGDPERRPDSAPRIGVCRSPTWDKRRARNPRPTLPRRLRPQPRRRPRAGPRTPGTPSPP